MRSIGIYIEFLDRERGAKGSGGVPPNLENFKPGNCIYNNCICNNFV